MMEYVDEVAEKAFNLLSSLKPQSETNVPYCLRGSSNRYCYICGFRTKDLADFILHRIKFHNDEGTSSCCFCSMKFNDSFTRYMHQMVIIYTQKCENCLENLTPIHVCSPEKLKNSNENFLAYHCTLGCDLRMKYSSKKQIVEHFQALHGVDERDVTVDEDNCNTEVHIGDTMEECSECGILINPEHISMAHHIIHECFARGRVQSVFVRYINDLAESQRMDPELILRYELISQLLCHHDDETELETLYEMDIVNLFLSWSESLNADLSHFKDDHINFIVQIYTKNLIDPITDANFRRNPVPISYNIKSAPEELTIDRVIQELKDFNKENIVPNQLNLPLKSVLMRVVEELGKID
ncbi:uncharacterized protein [Lepeophtheirus salmonis]|uniref:uncharacterized protein n=1 Tax=Lepeophtheirus salmonis TaxID=72036 RepID=UPI001AE4EE15|nr:uncharacterized protein LOC121114357 [Lepeophtheirus salmonis]XP_040564239.1 uncharacterized protein LOC121114357 [Lepeophtheirus salmonis]